MTHSNTLKPLVLYFVLSFFCHASASALELSSTAVIISDLHVLDSLHRSEDSATIIITTSGRDYTLKLKASGVTAKTTYERHANLPVAVSNQYFQGKVEGDINSWVRLTRDINGISGYLKAYDQLIKLSHPVPNQHSLNRISNADRVFVGSGTDRQLRPPKLFPRDVSSVKTELGNRASSGDSGTGSVTRVLQISIVVDSRFDEFYNGKGLEKAIAIINETDGLYQEQFGLAIQLKSALLLDAENDPFRTMDGNIETVLREFRFFNLDRPEFSKKLGLLHLFSGTYDDANIIGLSWINSICRTDGYNASISTPFSQQTLLTAHEMGHNLGAVHDDDNQCEVEYNKVMWPNISNNTSSEFSDCSKNSIKKGVSASCNLDNIDMGVSLNINPTSLKSKAKAVRITATNFDENRNARGVTSITALSDTIVPTNIPTNCTYFSNTLSCNHGTIGITDKHSIIVNMLAEDNSNQVISSELEFSNFTDLSLINNYASLDLKTAVPVTDEDQSSESTLGKGGSGGGNTDLILLIWLLFSIVLRKHLLSGPIYESVTAMRN